MNKWESLQEIRDLGLKSAPAFMFKSTNWGGIVGAIRDLDYCCGLRTDRADNSAGLPFFLPQRKPSSGEQFLSALHEWYHKVDVVIVQFSPNLVEDQIWDMVCYLTDYRELYGEICIRDWQRPEQAKPHSLREAWATGVLYSINSRFDALNSATFNRIHNMRKVRGNLIKKRLYNRRIEVSYFPNLGHYYWQIGDYDERITTGAGWSSGSSAAP